MTLKEFIEKTNEAIADRLAKPACVAELQDIPTFVLYAATDFFKAAEVAQKPLHVHASVAWKGNTELMLSVWPSEENPLRAITLSAGSGLDTRVTFATLTKKRVPYEKPEPVGLLEGKAGSILVAKELVPTAQAVLLLNNTAEEILQQAKAAIWSSAAHIIKRANVLVEAAEELGTARLCEILTAAQTVQNSTGLYHENTALRMPDIFTKETAEKVKALMAELPTHLDKKK